MKTHKVKPFVLLITGPLAAGKTTLANFLKKKLPKKTVFIDLDQMKLLFNCYKKEYYKNWISRAKTSWYGRVTRLAIISMIRAYTKEKINVVVAGNWSMKRRKIIRKGIKNINFLHFLLSISLDNSFKRVKNRNGRVFPRRLKELYDKNSTPRKDTIVIDANKKITEVRKDVMKILKGKII